MCVFVHVHTGFFLVCNAHGFSVVCGIIMYD